VPVVQLARQAAEEIATRAQSCQPVALAAYLAMVVADRRYADLLGANHLDGPEMLGQPSHHGAKFSPALADNRVADLRTSI
jgi:hypothetical protein